ncbi:MAG: hypothetical protein JW874_00635 [Spirochaetales bacterium]|nr:hypothetical protein [Spirochaetales bacterium]
MNATINALEEHFPGIGSCVEKSDVATPISCQRYSGNWKGSTQGWIITREIMKKLILGKQLPKTFPGIGRFCLIGQWAVPGGGLPQVAQNGRDIIGTILNTLSRKRTG